ncbi:hypothetical protein BpHYR1_007628 [Brachionus plicatilis]|uniref:Uncharacterized protein n=1 Tax=Brachionus plicatilis TaxID=10195 RepID=A0A3M7RCD8_BRAPC|nr:hypothetical protein BpHYR1_007628 [Brachionus plicatilis]
MIWWLYCNPTPSRISTFVYAQIIPDIDMTMSGWCLIIRSSRSSFLLDSELQFQWTILRTGVLSRLKRIEFGLLVLRLRSFEASDSISLSVKSILSSFSLFLVFLLYFLLVRAFFPVTLSGVDFWPSFRVRFVLAGFDNL